MIRITKNTEIQLRLLLFSFQIKYFNVFEVLIFPNLQCVKLLNINIIL